jgi:phytoene synthase
VVQRPLTDTTIKSDLDACRALLLRRNRALFAAILIAPPRVRDAATALFAFFVSIEEAARRDGAPPEVIEELRGRTLRAWSGEPDDAPIDRAFSRVVGAYGLPRAIFDLALEGFAWDADLRRYATHQALVDYAVRTSATRAVCLCVVMGRRKRAVLERACDLGIAIKLTTIARDVGTDAEHGRLYLPIEWLEEAGVDVDLFLDRPLPSPPVRGVIRRLLQSADAFFLRADPGIGALPIASRPFARTARYVYSAIGDEIERAGGDSIGRRASISAPRLARLVLRALRAPRSESRPIDQARIQAVAALVDAVAQ